MCPAPPTQEKKLPLNDCEPLGQFQNGARLIVCAIHQLVQSSQKRADYLALQQDHCVTVRLPVMHTDRFKRFNISVERSVHSFPNAYMKDAMMSSTSIGSSRSSASTGRKAKRLQAYSVRSRLHVRKTLKQNANRQRRPSAIAVKVKRWKGQRVARARSSLS